jgi:hypothetical protein
VGNISRKYPTDITPSSATFATWQAIYVWQALWLIYNFVLIFLKFYDYPLYVKPPVLTIFLHVFVFFNWVFNISWLFTIDDENLTVKLFSSSINTTDFNVFISKITRELLYFYY